MGLAPLEGSAALNGQRDISSSPTGPRLLELSLRGFKSFANETVIRFAPALTGIVGPNGSGKSNIVDALRWVSGERSRQAFRVAQISEVVHLGPRGRPGWARVSLRIDPSGKLPWAEVNLSRTFFADGAQEFTLNGARVRLRDIETTLDHLGVLSFIVAQGEVEWMLQLRPDALRERLELALGLEPIKANLTRAREDLASVQDAMVHLSASHSEVMARFQTLDRMVRQGQEWRRLDNQARRLCAQIYWKRLCGMRSEEEALQSQLQASEEALSQGRIELDTVHDAMDCLAGEISRLEGEAHQAETDLRSLEVAQAADRARLEILLETIGQGQSRVRALSEQLTGLLSQTTGATDSLEAARRKRDEVISKKEALEEAWVSLKERLSDLQAERDILRSRELAELSKLESASGQLEAQLRRVRGEWDSLTHELERLQNTVDDIQARLLVLDAEWTTVQGRIEAGKREMEDLAKRLATMEDRARELEAVRNHGSGSLRRLEDRLETLRGEIARVKARLARGSMVPRAVEEILAAGRAGKLPGIVGAVAHLLNVPDQYSQAIWAAIGARRWYVVTDSWRAAVLAVEMLRQRRVGRATFLPLDTIKPVSHAGSLAVAGLVGRAAELVSAPADLRPVVDLLLGRVVVVQDLEAARRALDQLPGLTLVTLSGDVVRSTGELTGGWAGSAHDEDHVAKLSRLQDEESRLASELAETAERRRLADTSLLEVRRELAEIRYRMTAWESDLQSLLASRNRIDQQRHSLAGDLQRRQLQSRELAQHRAALEDQVARLQKEQAEVDTRLKQARAMHAVALSRSAELEGRVREVSLELRRIESLRTTVAEELQDAEREVASWEVRVAGMHMARTRLENEQQQLQAHIAGLEAQLSEVKERIRAREPEILDLSKRKDFISGQIMSKKLQLQAHEGKLKRLTSVLTELKANQERIRAQLDELTSASAELELKAREELGRGWKELLNGDLAEDPEAALNEIRNRQRRLVLPDQDIELEHREVSRRLRAIEEQMADISEAAETLSSKIKELEIRLRSGWKSGFKALNGYVTEIWCELFGGGSAELLEDEDGGVRLEATPPGKRIKSLTSLSGGERALASMTLVISMLKAGSFPVCVLDEVDAALDDLRAARLATVLGRLANQVQFVIVTHNRHTIQACQALYGFAVDGQGSTKVISLKVWHPQEA